MKRILVAVDDSSPAMAAAASAIELASDIDAELHFVAVTEFDHDLASALRHVRHLAERAGRRAISSTADGGQPFEVLLRVANEWQADLIVMGRSDIRRPGVPYVGSQTEHLLEFTSVPVLVVPQPSHRSRQRQAKARSPKRDPTPKG
ncbi:MAG: universal stress protein [Acidimicrobiia bacterium]|nr:universal stress protein [Acidimicrobiia bacterium]